MSDEKLTLELPGIEWMWGFSALTQRLEGQKILDVGCGFGFGMSSLRSSKFQVDGVDIDSKVVEYCTVQNDFCVIKSSAEKLPLDARSYDTAFSMNLLQYTINPVRVVQEMNRVAFLKTLHVIQLAPKAEDKREYSWETIEEITKYFADLNPKIIPLPGDQVLLEFNNYQQLPQVVEEVKNLSDFVVIPDFISLAGAAIKNDQSEADMDAVIHFDLLNPGIVSNTVEVEFLKQLPEVLQGKLRLLGRSSPCERTRVPLYDLVARVKPELMVEEEEIPAMDDHIRLMQPFNPLNPEIQELGCLSKIVVQGWIEKWLDSGVVVHRDFDGSRTIIHKNDDDIRIYTENTEDGSSGGDLALRFPNCLKELREKVKGSIVLDCAMFVLDNKGDSFGREAELDVLLAGKPHDNQVVFFAFDCLWDGKTSLDRVSLLDRSKILVKRLPKGLKHFRCVSPAIHKSMEAVRKAVVEDTGFGAVGVQGVILKAADSTYALNGTTDQWYGIKTVQEIVAQVLKVVPVTIPGEATRYCYLCGIFGREGELQPIGGTRSTLIKADIGDLLQVRVRKIWFQVEKQKYFWNIAQPRGICRKQISPANCKSADLIGTMTASFKIPTSVLEKELRRTSILESDLDVEEMSQAILMNSLDRFKGLFTDVKPGTTGRYVIQHHTIGDGGHFDFRYEVDGYLLGYTMFGAPAGQGKTILSQFARGSKMLRGIPKSQKIPKRWLTVSGKLPEGEPGSTGTTPGVIKILDSGTCICGYQNPYGREYELKGRILKGKLSVSGVQVSDLPGGAREGQKPTDRIWIFRFSKGKKTKWQEEQAKS